MDPRLERLEAICLAFPEAVHAGGVVEHTFRVREKIFAMFLDDHHRDGRVAVWCKAPAGMQEMLVDSDQERFFVPPYVGPKGWIGVRLDVDVDWEELADLIDESYRLIAPKRLVALLDAAG